MTGWIRMVLALALIAGLSALAGTAGAQGLGLEPEAAVDDSILAHDLYLKLPPDEQERLIEEATTVHDYCTGRELFASLYDCRCVAAKFLDERVLRYDPTESIIGIADQVAKSCPNEPGVAGYAYTQCNKIYQRKMSYGLEEFCKCYANTFTKLYMKNPHAHFSHLTSLGTASILECNKNKDIPSPLRQ